MNTDLRHALAAAAVVIVGSLAIGCQPSGSSSGGSSASSSPPASPTQALRQSPPTSAIYAEQPGGGAELAPGSYVVTSIPPLRVTFSLPPGWYKGEIDWAVFSNDSLAVVSFGSPDNIYVDLCTTNVALRDPAVGPTVADLATALATVPGLEASPPSDVTLAGFSGSRIDLTATGPWDGCDGEPILWDVDGEGVPAPGPGERLELRILDVEGTRLVIGSRIRPGAAAQVVAELTGIVDSIQVDGP
jgi:hypothetical protein